ncbi:hypothetical protein J41TS12_48880 [Paenibacillus antibioticophila]|uniref:Uncharacterized protein n=1 Tax=Paenibacillus antibioticophila TaxID=1274374 RepID=A0A919Y0N2_9BACL|nr:hypothetical protein [Paenibacillus antibioticophila]GIO40027.1 hypothetical protein J41TS12_48880 [Paenibacillus antibioticophila]
MKWFRKKLQLATIASALVVSSLVVPLSAFADSFTPSNIGQSVIVPYMGNERLIVNGRINVSRTYDFGYFDKLYNNSIKVVWSPIQTTGNNFKLQVIQTSWLGDDYAIAEMSLGNSTTTDYFTNLPLSGLHLRAVGSAYGDISAYDWGPNNP